MTDSEAVIVAKIMLTADGWCRACSDRLLEQLQLAFQGQDAMISSVRASREGLQQRWYENRGEFDAGRGRLMQVWEL